MAGMKNSLMNQNEQPTERQTDLMDPSKYSTEMQTSLQAVDFFIRRNYLAELSSHEVLPLEKGPTNNIRMYRVGKIIFDKDEDINEKLTSIYSAIQNVSATAFVYLKGSEEGVEYYLGARSETGTAGILANVLTYSFSANFPGSSLENKQNNELGAILDNQNFSNICSVTVVPSAREDNEMKFVQGLEKLIDAMRGKPYTALFIASPVSKAELGQRRLGLEQLYTSIAPFAKTTVAYGENESNAVSEGAFTNFSSTVNEGVSNTIGDSFSRTNSETYSKFFSDGTRGTSETTTISSSNTFSKGTAESKGHGSNHSTSTTTGTNLTYTIEAPDKTVEGLLQYIEEQLERIKVCESFGVWETAAYFCSKQIENALVAASTFKALVSGDETYIENAFINVWDNRNRHTQSLVPYLQQCQHPRFALPGFGAVSHQIVTPGNHISGKELPVFMGIPQKSVAGVTVTTIAEFGRNVTVVDPVGSSNSAKRTLPLGCIHHMGEKETDNIVKLDLDSFTSHCFVCGSTGSGKSNTVGRLLQNFIHNKIPFLVIEPAKGEYKNDFGAVPGINIFTTNPYMGAMLKINPFEFHPNIHVLEHLDRLIEIFNACWEMYAAMPAILKNAIEKAYILKGWDLQSSVYLEDGAPQFPSFADVLSVLPSIIKTSGYSADTQGDYTGALVTRMESLTNGLCGQIFCDNYYVTDSTLFDQNTIVDLSRIGSTETKSLIMGILVLRLNEYRMANATGSNKKLMHVTVLEEAHNLLKNTSQVQGQSSANPVGKSVEMICNGIAEMRTYGEGFIIVDQSPSSVDIAAIKNTNTKIVMRMPEAHDCEAIGRSLSLNDEQIQELSKLPVGVAAVLQNNWLETVLCSVEKAHNGYYKESQVNTFEQVKKLRSTVLEAVFPQLTNKVMECEKLCAVVEDSDVSVALKKEMCNRLLALCDSYGRETSNQSFYISLLYLSGLVNVFSAEEDGIRGKETNQQACIAWKDTIVSRIRGLFVFQDEKTYALLVRHCLFASRWITSKTDYAAVYRSVYKKG